MEIPRANNYKSGGKVSVLITPSPGPTFNWWKHLDTFVGPKSAQLEPPIFTGFGSS